MTKPYIFLLSFFLLMNCASKEEEIYTPIPYNLEIPQLFADKLISPIIPTNNPLTEEGVALGKKLFFDTIENQAFEPVSNPIELHANWKKIAKKMQNHPEYPNLFLRAFGTATIDSTLITKAIAQFERTLISGNSKFDQFLLGNETLTPEEANGFNVFMDEAKGDCFHCHGSNNNPLWTDNQFHNNGLDSNFTDVGLGKITGDPADNGKFKSPSLRNLAFTAPYMHDGRFATLEEVINHYSEGLKPSATIDPLMKKIDKGGVHLSTKDKTDLKAFLLSLTDLEFVNNTAFQE